MLAAHGISDETIPLTPRRRRRRMPSLMGRRRSAAPAAPALPSPTPSSSSVSAPDSLTPQAPALQAPPHSRRQPVLLSRPAQSRRARCAELAGGTAADCAAVWCCCPCGILDLVVLAVVKVPAGLCRRAFVKNRRKRLASARKVAAVDGVAGRGATRRGLLGPRVMHVDDDEDEDEFIIFTAAGAGPVVVRPGAKGLLLGAAVGWPEQKSPSDEVSEMDEQMWAHFYGTGFWRSPSQKDSLI